MGSTAAIRRRQLEVADGPEGLGIVLEWVQAKLRHQAEFLEELRHRRPESDGLFIGPLGAIRAGLDRLAATARDGGRGARHAHGAGGECRPRLLGLPGPPRAGGVPLRGAQPPAGRGRVQRRVELFLRGFVLPGGAGVRLRRPRPCTSASCTPTTTRRSRWSSTSSSRFAFWATERRCCCSPGGGRRRTSSRRYPAAWRLTQGGTGFFLANFNERLDKAVRYPVQGKPGKTRNVKAARHDPVRGARPGQPPAGPAGPCRAWSRSRSLWDESNEVAGEDAVELDEPGGNEEGGRPNRHPRRTGSSRYCRTGSEAPKGEPPC